MHMNMHARLTSCFAYIHTDVVSIRRVLSLDLPLRLTKEVKNSSLFFGGHVKEVCDVAFRNDKHMSAAKGVVVISHIGQRVLSNHFSRFAQFAIGYVGGHSRSCCLTCR